MKKVLYVLAELNDADVDWMTENGSRDSLRPQEILITQGVHTDSLFFVLDGRFEVSIDGTEVATVGAGAVLGEISFVDSHPPTATVKALDASRVLAIPRTSVQHKLDTDPPFAARFYRAVSVFLADRLRSTLQQVSGGEAPDEMEELDLDRLESVSRAGERFRSVLQSLSN